MAGGRAQGSVKAPWLSPTGVEVGGEQERVAGILPSEALFERLLGRQTDRRTMNSFHVNN